MKNLKMSKKLFVSFGIVIFMIIILGATAFFGLSKMSNVVNTYGEKTVPNTEYIWQVRRNILSVQRYLLRTIVAPTKEESLEISQLADAESKALLQSLDDYRKNMRTDPALTDTIEQYIKESAGTRKKIQELALLSTTEANEEAYRMYVSDYLPEIEKMNETVLSVTAEVKSLEVAQNNTAKQVYNISLVAVITAFLGAVAFSVGMGIVLSRNIVQPLKEIENAANKMVDGDLNAVITYTSKDELGSLSGSMTVLVETLRAIIGDVGYLLGEMGAGNFNCYA